MSQIQEIPDYNKMYNTSSYSSTHPMQPVAPDAQPQQQPQPKVTSNSNNNNLPPMMNHNTNGGNNVNGYGPLDYGYGMTPPTTNISAPVNMTPFQAPPDSNGQQAGGISKGHRRSSVGNFFDSVVVGVDSSQQIPMRKTVTNSTSINNSSNTVRRRSSIAKFLMPDTQPNSTSLGRRRSSAFTSLGYKTDAGGDEHKGPYAHVSRCQAEHMDRIREAEKNLNLTHNKDGLPLPKDSGGRRRSSLAHILGLDKPLLAR
ncbi:MAG: hypothetical protein J3R72DRAFT_91872 [Linnemannia gamsii]|nr:MAG: hypothetical protein J3R72DRAFT_91872 [Linnemannia gamsii]